MLRRKVESLGSMVTFYTLQRGVPTNTEPLVGYANYQFTCSNIQRSRKSKPSDHLYIQLRYPACKICVGMFKEVYVKYIPLDLVKSGTSALCAKEPFCSGGFLCATESTCSKIDEKSTELVDVLNPDDGEVD